MARLLIADDDRLFRRHIRQIIDGWGYEVDEAENGREAWEKLTALDPPDIALLDWMMPELDGIELCRRMRFRRSFQSTYLLLLSGRSRSKDVVAGLRSGADDYLAKPVDVSELEARLLVGMRSVELRTELDQSRDRLLREATHDVLTEILNRRGIVDALQREHSRSARDGSPLSVALIDVDHFKKINDRWGHQAGDQVLSGIASRLSSGLRGYDTAGRFGGEEFLLLLPGTDRSAAAETTERIRKLIRSEPFDAGGKQIDVTISAGVAAIRSLMDDPNDLLRRADEALYRAKNGGRDRVEVDEAVQPREPRIEPIPSFVTH